MAQTKAIVVRKRESEYNEPMLLLIYDTLRDQLALLEPESQTVLTHTTCYYRDANKMAKQLELESGRLLEPTDAIIGVF